MKKMAEIRKETLDKVTAKLNDEQQKTWKELLGAPFRSDKPDPRPANDRAADGFALSHEIPESAIRDLSFQFAADSTFELDTFRPSLRLSAHSTVTLLARLRGLSISQPRRRATWYASNWSGTTARSGWTTSGASGIGRKTSDNAATASSPSVPTVMIDAVARLDLLDVAERLGVQRAARGHEDARSLAVDQRDRPVFHLGRRIALGVDIADLLELERAFQARRENGGRGRDRGRCVAEAEPLGGLLDQRLGLEDLAEQGGNRFDRVHDGQAVGERELSQPAQIEGQQERAR